MALTKIFFAFAFSVVFSAHALKLSDNNPTKSADGTTYSCKVGDSKAEKCCTLTKKTNDDEDVDELNQPEDFRPTAPGHSPGVGHSFTCSFTQSTDDDKPTSQDQSCACQKAECQPNDHCNVSHVKKKKC